MQLWRGDLSDEHAKPGFGLSKGIIQQSLLTAYFCCRLIPNVVDFLLGIDYFGKTLFQDVVYLYSFDILYVSSELKWYSWNSVLICCGPLVWCCLYREQNIEMPGQLCSYCRTLRFEMLWILELQWQTATGSDRTLPQRKCRTQLALRLLSMDFQYSKLSEVNRCLSTFLVCLSYMFLSQVQSCFLLELDKNWA